MNVCGSAKILTNVQTFQDCGLHQWNVRYELHHDSRYWMWNLKVAFRTHAWTLNEVKIIIETARQACPESKDESHFQLLPLFVPIAEFDPADQCFRCGMSVGTEMLCDGKTRWILVNASEMFTKTFPQSAPNLADVIERLSLTLRAWSYVKRQTAKMKLLPSFFSSLNSRVKIVYLWRIVGDIFLFLCDLMKD